MSQAEEEARRRAERARRVGLFRYEVIQEVVDPSLSTRQRGRMVRQLAAAEHRGPSGEPVRVSRASVDRWVRAWRAGGFEALVPSPARVEPRTPGEVLDMAAGLKRENPARTAAQVARILRASSGWAPSERTLQRHFLRLGLPGAPPGPGEVFGRFEAGRPNELWTGDALHGPPVAGRKTYLMAFVDDHSRAVMGARFGHHEDSVRLAAALRPGLAARGVPERIYVDNGSAFVDSWLLRGCATLGIKLTHSTPGRPEGRGKIERFFETVRAQFLVEIAPVGGLVVADLAELNRKLTAWVETVYHAAVHSETGQAPLARWHAGIPDPLPRPSPARLREAFLWSERRTVTKSGTVSLHGNVFEVDHALVGRGVELLFDPFDLADVEVRCGDRSFGPATPFRIGRHSHPKARPEHPEDPPAPATGVNYLHLLEVAHAAQLEKPFNYAAIVGDTPAGGGTGTAGGPGRAELPGQLDLTELPEITAADGKADPR